MARQGPKSSRRLDDRLASLREAVGGAPDPDDRELFGLIAELVAERRKAWGVSQRELAELCGTTQSAIARVERGRGRPGSTPWRALPRPSTASWLSSFAPGRIRLTAAKKERQDEREQAADSGRRAAAWGTGRSRRAPPRRSLLSSSRSSSRSARSGATSSSTRSPRATRSPMLPAQKLIGAVGFSAVKGHQQAIRSVARARRERRAATRQLGAPPRGLPNGSGCRRTVS